MFCTPWVYVTMDKCGTFARVVAVSPTEDVESSSDAWDDDAVFQGAGWVTRVNDDVAAQQATNAKLKARNDQLFAEIDDLNGGQEALEERARNELSMTRPGETFYRLVPDASKRAQSAGQNNR